MRNGMIVAVAGLAFLAGCDMGNEAPKAPAPAKWKAPYQIEFDTKAVKPNPAGVTVPAINYTADPKAQERRATLVVRFDASETKNDDPSRDGFILGPVDLPGTEGTLPAAYLESADKGLAGMLGYRCMKGKVKIRVALVRSSIKPDASEGEIDTKRLTEWLPAEVEFKNPHAKC
jgi:hypothetical protein